MSGAEGAMSSARISNIANDMASHGAGQMAGGMQFGNHYAEQISSDLIQALALEGFEQAFKLSGAMEGSIDDTFSAIGQGPFGSMTGNLGMGGINLETTTAQKGSINPPSFASHTHLNKRAAERGG